jgi:galactokinase
MSLLWALLAEERPPHELARIHQRAENQYVGYVGVRSRIMDQLASATGRQGRCWSHPAAAGPAELPA